LRDEVVSSDLGELDLDDIDKIFSCFITDERALKELLKGDLLNTENFPYLEFESPKYGYGDKPLNDNLMLLERSRVSVLDLLSGISDSEKERLESFVRAASFINKGHINYRTLRLVPAADFYQKAQAIAPDDKSAKTLLEFEEMRKRIKVYPADWGMLLTMGQILVMQERWEESLEYLHPILEPEGAMEASKIKKGRPPSPNVQQTGARLLGVCYEKLGDREKAAQYYTLSRKILP
jgi:tetratricopeptide (TPR) repeat protein